YFDDAGRAGSFSTWHRAPECLAILLHCSACARDAPQRTTTATFSPRYSISGRIPASRSSKIVRLAASSDLNGPASATKCVASALGSGSSSGAGSAVVAAVAAAVFFDDLVLGGGVGAGAVVSGATGFGAGGGAGATTFGATGVVNFGAGTTGVGAAVG